MRDFDIVCFCSSIEERLVCPRLCGDVDKAPGNFAAPVESSSSFCFAANLLDRTHTVFFTIYDDRGVAIGKADLSMVPDNVSAAVHQGDLFIDQAKGLLLLL